MGMIMLDGAIGGCRKFVKESSLFLSHDLHLDNYSFTSLAYR